MKTLQIHLAKTQYYRWYQLYERPMTDARIRNQLELLAEDILLQSAAGEMRGKESYPERLKVYEGWQNAHHVQEISIQEHEDGFLQLNASIRYQNIKPDGEKASYTIDYTINFESFERSLPQFKTVKITPTGQTNDIFADAYPENRCKASMHYWLANMEQCDGNATPFVELLADRFELNFSSGKVSSIEELSTWLNGAPKHMKESNHHPENFKVTVIDKNTYEINVEFDWNGITLDDKKMIARTAHHWILTDNPEERFARIKTMNVTALVPFTVVES
ncbi:hypothetical protein [uncultured Kordia sp.]|uniref:hypothetical protein n=1 Tax=uncultured Kordia sp. TaxID=507699 RepID=UPI002616FFCB|nr:hypothetical protein [uncultured Kordia sp.]